MSKLPQEVEYLPVYGTVNNDIIIDTEYLTEFYGLQGNDVFMAAENDSYGFPGSYYFMDDYFYGGSGSDTISYQASDKKIMANLGTGIAHRIFQGQAQSTDYLDSIENLNGSNYNDTIYGSNGANLLRGLGGNDTILGLDGNDHVWGDSGNDTLDGGEGDDIVDGGSGNDAIDGGDGADTLNGGDGSDTIEGGNHDDTINGGGHGDQLFGQSGSDRIEGGIGNDEIDGGTGIDTAVYTGSGDVTVNLLWSTASGAMGNDTLTSIEKVETGSGDDVVFGSNTGDQIKTGSGNDVVYALGGSDIVYGQGGNDSIFGYDGIDIVYGGTGNDMIGGGGDADTLHGENGNDAINGDDGSDFIMGGDGNDRLRGGDGLDTINGGAGADVIVWQAGDTGADLISGFDLGEDKLWFGSGFFAADPVGDVGLIDVLTVFDQGDDAVLAANTASAGWTVIATLVNVEAYELGQLIASENILAPAEVNFGGMPDGIGL